MGWYNVFSNFYDRSLEKLYRQQRKIASERLDLHPGQTVLDCPTGTGQSLDELSPGVGPDGRVIGVDLSKGMLKRARARTDKQALANVSFVEASVHDVQLEPGTTVDRLHIFLGLSAFPDFDDAFGHLWSLLAPGGRCVVVDCHDANPGFQGKMVNLVARADIRRETWKPLEARAESYAFEDLPSLPKHGGQLFLATGIKPSS